MSWPSPCWLTALPARPCRLIVEACPPRPHYQIARRISVSLERSRIFLLQRPKRHQLGKTARSESHGKLQPRGHRPLAAEALAERTPWAATVQSLRGLWGRASRKQAVPDGMVRPRAAHSSRKCVSQDPKIAVRAVLRARSSLARLGRARFLRGGNCQDNHVRKCSLSSPRRNGSRPRKLFHRESGAPKAPPRPPPHPRSRPGPCSHRPSQSDAGRDQTRGSSCASSCRR